MDKQITEQGSLNTEKALYNNFSAAARMLGGIIGGLLAWQVMFSGDWRAFPYCMMSGWLFGLPAAWLTVRSVCKRGLRRNWKGCLKTAAWGAWWGAAATGGLLLLLGGRIISHIAQASMPLPTDEIALFAALCLAILALCGLVSAALLSLLLPKPETDSQTAFRQPEKT